MKKTEIDALAWSGEPIPQTASSEDICLYCISRAVYDLFEKEVIDKEKAQTLKQKALDYIEALQTLARGNSAIIRTIATATAPRADLVKKSKVQLLDYIAKIESVASGLIKTMDEHTPDFMKLEVEK